MLGLSLFIDGYVLVKTFESIWASKPKNLSLKKHLRNVSSGGLVVPVSAARVLPRSAFWHRFQALPRGSSNPSGACGRHALTTGVREIHGCSV